VDLEKLGIPTVTLCTDVFVQLAREESRALGMAELPLAIVPHPLGGEAPEAIRQRARVAVDQVVQGLTGANGGGARRA
jgi:hypothetical protein